MFACFKNFVNHKDEVSPEDHKDIWPSSYTKYGVFMVCSNSQFDYRIPGRRKSNLYNCRVNLWRLINIFLVKEWRSEECCQWISPRAKVFQSGLPGSCFFWDRKSGTAPCSICHQEFHFIPGLGFPDRRGLGTLSRISGTMWTQFSHVLEKNDHYTDLWKRASRTFWKKWTMHISKWMPFSPTLDLEKTYILILNRTEAPLCPAHLYQSINLQCCFKKQGVQYFSLIKYSFVNISYVEHHTKARRGQFAISVS